MSEMNHQDHEHNESKGFHRDSRYWQSLADWAQDPEFQKTVETEFQSSPLREGEAEEGWARREFLKLMGASLAMASAGCIRRPVQKIVPYNKQPEEVTFGVTNFYSSTWSDGVESVGLLVRTREGRPLKVEGNPLNPLTKGGTSVRAQAHILSLYDPERLQGPRKLLQNNENTKAILLGTEKAPEGKGKKAKLRTSFEAVSVKYEDADAEIVKALKNGGVTVLTGPQSSPSTRAVIADFCQAFNAQHVVWGSLADEMLREASKASYGDSAVPSYRFDLAKVIVSVDADFLGTWMMPTTFNRQFSMGRKDPKKMSKLVVFDSAYSLTGANADVRVRIKPSQQLEVVLGLAHEIIVKKGQTRFAGNGSVKSILDPYANVAQNLKIEAAAFARLAEDLAANKGKGLIVAGGLPTHTENALALQIAVNFLNSALENEGSTVDSRHSVPAAQASLKGLSGLIEAMNKGSVKTLIIHQANPMYASPLAKEFHEALKNVDLVIYTGDRVDETGRLADYMLPDHHPMEGWSDSEPVAGVYTIQQPTIRPMYDTRSFQLSLMTWGYLAEKGPKRLTSFETTYDYVRNFWKEEIFPKHGKGRSFEAFWNDVLQKGVVGEEALTAGSSARSFKTEALSQIKAAAKPAGMELVLYPTVALMDGSLANVAWLQELPDPVTKICWDNYACVAIGTAEKLHLKEGDMVEVKVGSQVTKLPVHIQPGLHEDVVAVPVGYGRTHAGKVANNVGYNSYQLAQLKDGAILSSGLSAEVKKAAGNYRLANTQAHHSMEGRQIVVEATLEQYLKDPGAGIHRHAVFSIWSGHRYDGNKWGMAIDQNVCTGCNACVVACQSENNIPVVGKKYVLQGREMHWLRIDRYHVGSVENAETVFQPMLCQHCGTAPCETVCPVLATVHNSEGLNDMVYNRCVGTRYCSNNCPYKVRRFNWFNYTKNIEKPMHLALNPDVTVRSRGVMEKCTFCVHRIKAGKIQAKVEKRELKDGDIVTACAQACPTDAIVFGDLNDENSAVAKIFREEKRAYGILEEFNTQPSVMYMSKIRNNDKAARFDEKDAHKGGHA